MYTKQQGKIYIVFAGVYGFLRLVSVHVFFARKAMDNLAKEDPTKFHHMAEYFGTEKIDLFLRKQIYPYEYLDSE